MSSKTLWVRKVEKILEGCLDSMPSPSVKIQITKGGFLSESAW